MEVNGNKCVIVIGESLSLGIIANTAGIMGLTLGKHIPETIGPELQRVQRLHPEGSRGGGIRFPILWDWAVREQCSLKN